MFEYYKLSTITVAVMLDDKMRANVLVGQICEKIVGFGLKAPNFAKMMLMAY